VPGVLALGRAAFYTAIMRYSPSPVAHVKGLVFSVSQYLQVRLIVVPRIAVPMMNVLIGTERATEHPFRNKAMLVLIGLLPTTRAGFNPNEDVGRLVCPSIMVATLATVKRHPRRRGEECFPASLADTRDLRGT
jgi:hypothetical protein